MDMHPLWTVIVGSEYVRKYNILGSVRMIAALSLASPPLYAEMLTSQQF